MKKITPEQVDAILETFFKLNAPIQVYSSVQKMLKELPDVKEKK